MTHVKNVQILTKTDSMFRRAAVQKLTAMTMIKRFIRVQLKSVMTVKITTVIILLTVRIRIAQAMTHVKNVQMQMQTDSMFRRAAEQKQTVMTATKRFIRDRLKSVTIQKITTAIILLTVRIRTAQAMTHVKNVQTQMQTAFMFRRAAAQKQTVMTKIKRFIRERLKSVMMPKITTAII